MFDQSEDQDISITMSRSIYRRLLREADELNVPIEWLVASLVADTIDDESIETRKETVAA